MIIMILLLLIMISDKDNDTKESTTATTYDDGDDKNDKEEERKKRTREKKRMCHCKGKCARVMAETSSNCERSCRAPGGEARGRRSWRRETGLSRSVLCVAYL